MRRCPFLLATFGALLVLTSGCSDDDENPPGPPITTVENQLVFRGPDGELIDFGPNATTYIWCGPWASDVEEPSLQIFTGGDSPAGGWRLWAVLDDIDPGTTVSFPNEFLWNQPRNAHIFVAHAPNELATDTEDSFGAITFTRLTCGTDGAVEFTIDATIGSEFGDGPVMTVSGSFRGPVGAAPDWYNDGN